MTLAGRDDGLYYSRLVNEIVNDTAMFDAESAYAVYNAGKEEID